MHLHTGSLVLELEDFSHRGQTKSVAREKAGFTHLTRDYIEVAVVRNSSLPTSK